MKDDVPSNISVSLIYQLLIWPLSHKSPKVEPTCKATFLSPEKWSFKRGGLSSGIEFNTIMLRDTVLCGLSEGVVSHQSGRSKVLHTDYGIYYLSIL